MAASYVNHTQSAGFATSRTASVPSGTVDGDVMIAFTTNNNTGTEPLTPPAGWTLMDEQNSSNVEMEAYYRVASSEPASYVWTWAGAHNHNVVIVTYRGVEAPPGWWDSDSASGVTIINAPSVEAAASGAMLVCAALHPNGGTWTETGGLMTPRITSGRSPLWDQVLASAGATGTRTLDTNTGTNANMASFAVVLEEAAAEPPAAASSGWGIISG